MNYSILMLTGMLLGGMVLPASGQAPAKPKAAAAMAREGELTLTKSLGSSKAPITIEVFSDFQCPACRELYLKTLRRVIEDYVLNDKVYLIHHDYPLPIHKYARDAARYANAAAAVNKYEAVSEALFNKQDTWTAAGNIEPVVAEVLSPAEMKKIKPLLQNDQIEAAIEKDIFLGNQNSVRQTPTMLIRRGQQSYPQAGVVTYSILRVFLDRLLSE